MIFLLSTYATANINNIVDSEIYLGAVAGVVTVTDCSNMKLTVACRKLIMRHCCNCQIFIATMTPTLIISDCDNLTFGTILRHSLDRSLTVFYLSGPHNISYKSLEFHLMAANLNDLITAQASLSSKDYSNEENRNFRGSDEDERNLWNIICDVGECIESSATVSSPTGYAIDAASAFYPLPYPSTDVAIILSPNSFYQFQVPDAEENQNISVSNRYHDVCDVYFLMLFALRRARFACPPRFVQD
jgi:hypothetical protein